MGFTHFFVDRPIFASVVSIFITLLGFLAYNSLPVTQYPEVAPPTIQVRASYPGASAETVADAVATPLEQEINGVEGMLYMQSQATGDGNLTLTITFELGTNLDEEILDGSLAAVPKFPERVATLVRQARRYRLVRQLFGVGADRALGCAGGSCDVLWDRMSTMLARIDAVDRSPPSRRLKEDSWGTHQTIGRHGLV